MSAPKAPRVDCTESEWQSFVTDCLDLGGWRWHHETDSRKSKSGFPDLIAVKGNQMIVLELKTQKGRVRPEQVDWLVALANVDGRVRVGVLRPSQWRDVLELTGVAEMVEGAA